MKKQIVQILQNRDTCRKIGADPRKSLSIYSPTTYEEPRIEFSSIHTEKKLFYPSVCMVFTFLVLSKILLRF